MFAIEVAAIFSAAHALRLPGGGAEPLHGHDFHVTVRVACDQLDALGTVVDFHALKDALEALVAPWRNQNLNDIPPFKASLNPSAEQIAQHIGRQLDPVVRRLDQGRRLQLMEVRITEAADCLAIWSPI